MNFTLARIRRFAVIFLCLQGSGGLGWWLGLLAFPAWRKPFLAPGAPDSTLLALGPADLIFYIGGSLLCAYGLGRSRVWAWPALCIHAGAAAYSGLCALTWPLLSHGGWLGALLMFPSLIVPLSLAWLLRPACLGGKKA